MFGFFFFKQKTAYEMLLCDWSSDVCSSDLVDELGADRTRERQRKGEVEDGEEHQRDREQPQQVGAPDDGEALPDLRDEAAALARRFDHRMASTEQEDDHGERERERAGPDEQEVLRVKDPDGRGRRESAEDETGDLPRVEEREEPLRLARVAERARDAPPDDPLERDDEV